MTQLRYAVLSHLAPWKCRIGFFQPSWGHLPAYITDALCPWPLDAGPAGFFGDKGHAYDHLLAELDALREVVDVEADKGYMPLLDPATELTLAFQFLHVHRSTELRKSSPSRFNSCMCTVALNCVRALMMKC